jgi:hypothetical protein
MAARIIPDSIRDVLNYDPETGDLTWKHNKGRAKVGAVAGSPCNNGYIQIKHERILYKAHRLAWFLANGEQPEEIDHINRNKADNRLCNLRNVTKSLNQLNSKATGITWRLIKRSGYTYVRATYRQKHLYTGPNLMVAHYRRIMAERADHPIGLPAPGAVG